MGILDEQLAANAVEYKPDIDVRDPVCDEFYFKAWMQTAEKNMEIYEEVLGGKNIPTDSVHSFAELKTFKVNRRILILNLIWTLYWTILILISCSISTEQTWSDLN